MQLWLCLKIFFKRKKRKPITPTYKLFKKPPPKQSTSSHRPRAVPASHSGRVWDPGSAKQGLAQPMRTARPGHSLRRCCCRHSPAADLQTRTQSPTSSCAAFTSQTRRDVQLCKVQINRAAKQQLFRRFQPFNSWLYKSLRLCEISCISVLRAMPSSPAFKPCFQRWWRKRGSRCCYISPFTS